MFCFWCCTVSKIFYVLYILYNCMYIIHKTYIICCCCCSVVQSCPALCDPMDCACQASLSFTISRGLLKLMSIETMMPSNHLILCHPLLHLPSVFPSIRVFSSESAVCISGQSIGASASATDLPVNIQGWFPLGLTGLILLRDSQEYSPASVFRHSLLYGPLLTSIHDYWKNHSFDCTDLCWQIDVSAF